jgi:hypothetical protein
MLGYEPTREDAMATSAMTSGVSERAWIGRGTARFRTISGLPQGSADPTLAGWKMRRSD